MSEAQATGLPEELDDVLAYLTTVGISLPQAITEPDDLEPIASQTPAEVMLAEIEDLPADALLYSYKHFEVYCGTADQFPNFRAVQFANTPRLPTPTPLPL